MKLLFFLSLNFYSDLYIQFYRNCNLQLIFLKMEKTVKDSQFQSNEYTLVKFIAKGSFGKVYLAINNYTGDQVAIKIMLVKPEDCKDRIQQKIKILQKEYEIIKNFDHQHVVKIHDFLYSNQEGNCGKTPFIIIELIKNGD